MSRSTKWYGWKPSIPDNRDLLFKNLKVNIPAKLPTKVDLSSNCSPVDNQGNLGSCTAHALSGAIEYNEIINKKFIDVSRLFIYYNERVLEHSVQSDSGAQLRDGIASLAKCGVCTETTLPYIISKFTMKPPMSAYKEALQRKITSYHRVLNLQEMKEALAGGLPFVFGFSVYDGFESPTVAKTGLVQLPTVNEGLVGGHAVLAVGYDDTSRRILVRNSWGVDWGLKGYFTLPYEYISNPNLADDFWVIVK